MPSEILERDRTDVHPRAEKRPRPFGDAAPVRQPADAPAAGKDDERPKPTLIGRLRAHPLVAGAAALIVIAAVVAAVFWWLDARQYESTDDAFIDARSISISPEVKGTIVEVPVGDNQLVEPGALLARIDRRDYQAAFDQAQAQLDQAHATLANIDAQIDAQQARIDQAHKEVAQAEAALNFSQSEEARARSLLQKGTTTEQQAEQAASDLRQKQAAYEGAEANATVAEKQIAVLKTQRAVAAAEEEQARAALTQASTNLDRTILTAPVAGRVAKIAVATGSAVEVGQSLMMVVPRAVWVTANFKETQLVDLHPGQPVDIRIDAYPGRSFAGRVDSIQSGSGAAFSLLPPENATGNFVKVLQRVPVKIVFDQPPDVLLGPGMSVVPRVKVQ